MTLDKKNRPLLKFFLAILIFCTLLFLGSMEQRNLLLLERFIPNFGGLASSVLLTIYGVFIYGKLLDIKTAPIWRKRIWYLFAMFFFVQLFAGILFSPLFLQTGKLHFPIPALILAGPIYRETGFFMLYLLLSTIILVGPSWCSYLCYIGPIDDYFSRKNTASWQKKRVKFLRINIFIITIIIAKLLQILLVPDIALVAILSLFSIISLLFIFIKSPKKGAMTHCTEFCPIGLITNNLGRINPFRIVINSKCTSCFACLTTCCYQALDKTSILNRIPYKTCTLCGDCITKCKHDAIEYKFLKWRGNHVRAIFLFIIVWLHTIFLAVARI